MTTVVIQTLSHERFGTYLQAANWNTERALKLYLWNMEIGAAFHAPVQAVEVSLRNAINQALRAEFGPDWWANDAFLDIQEGNKVAILEVIKRIRKRNLDLVTSQVVAGLSLGFWVGILHARYQPMLWSEHLRLAFPDIPEGHDREELRVAAYHTAELRNRISHHEPIFKRDLLKDFSIIMQLLKWICPATHDWVRPHCRVPELTRRKP